MFYSLQGEGTYTGVPSVFIRTSTCNLKCCFCDSPFSSWWNEGEKKTVNEIFNYVTSQFWYVKHIVITGGEPLLQKELPDLVNLFKRSNHYVTIETNGTIFKPDVIPDLFSISPKTNNSIPSETNRPQNMENWEKQRKSHLANMDLSALKFYIENKKTYELQFKFVIQSEDDLKEIENIIETYKIDNDLVYLMPEGYTRELQEKRSEMVAEICKQKRWNFCPRLQINLWGSKRGV
jgi:7-carboxy-7-deazaguanine synthase